MGWDSHNYAAVEWKFSMISSLKNILVSCREMERREKVEEARRETERMLAAQEAEVAARKVRAEPLQLLP
jgi:hypothetical protein